MVESTNVLSSTSADCDSVEFSQEDVETLLNEKMKPKNKFNEKHDPMMEYIMKLRQCIKWYQRIEKGYLLDLEKFRDSLQATENKHDETVMLIEDKLNSNIIELRKNCLALQEELELVAIDSFTREKEVKTDVEILNASLSDELQVVQKENLYANQKILSTTEACKWLQEYNVSLDVPLKRVEKEKNDVEEKLSTSRGQCSSLQEQLTTYRASNEEITKQNNVLAIEVGCIRRELKRVREDRDSLVKQMREDRDSLVKQMRENIHDRLMQQMRENWDSVDWIVKSGS